MAIDNITTNLDRLNTASCAEEALFAERCAGNEPHWRLLKLRSSDPGT